MGLDMYVFITAEPLPEAVDFATPKGTIQLHYWRKHPNMHGWMRELYLSKGGKEPDYPAVRLDLCDLDLLKEAIESGTLPETSGFFFGQSDGFEAEDDLIFVRRARQALEAGMSVYYVADW